MAKIWGAANNKLIKGITKYKTAILSNGLNFLFINKTNRSEIHIDKHEINPIGWVYMERVVRRTESTQCFREIPFKNFSDERKNSSEKEKDKNV